MDKATGDVSPPDKPYGDAGGLRKLFKGATPYFFLAPYILLFLIFGLFPLFFSIYLSFHQWNPVEGFDAMKYVGLENFGLALTDEWTWLSLKNTILMGIFAGLPQHLVAIPVACFLVSLGPRLRHWLTSALFLPYITSSVAVSLIFFQMFAPTSGLINLTLQSLAETPVIAPLFSWVEPLMPIKWLKDVNLVKPAVALVIFWKYVGFNIVIYTTGLMTIPTALYEAARIDGANTWHRFRYITLPMLKPFMFFAVTLTLIGSMQLFEEPYVLTNGEGGPSQSALTVSAHLMRMGWDWLEMGTASALSWLLFILISLMTAVKFFFFGKEGMNDAS